MLWTLCHRCKKS